MAGRRSKIQDAIERYLVEIGRPASAKEIAVAIGAMEHYDNVRKLLQRLAERKLIRHEIHGYYGARFSLEDILRAERPELTTHGIKLQGTVPTASVPEFVQGTPALSQSERSEEERGGVRWYWDGAYEGREVKIVIYENTKTVLISLRSSTFPITPIEFEGFAGWLEGIFNNQAVLLNLKVIQLGIGMDFKEYRLDGVKSITWKAWRSAYIELYQKSKDTLRLAIHLSNQNIDLIDAITILKGMTNAPLDVVSRYEVHKREGEQQREGYQ